MASCKPQFSLPERSQSVMWGHRPGLACPAGPPRSRLPEPGLERGPLSSQRKPPLLVEDFQARTVNETETEFMQEKYVESSLSAVA